MVCVHLTLPRPHQVGIHWTEGRKGMENPVVNSPSREAYRKQLAETSTMNRTRILALKNRPPTSVAAIQQAVTAKPFPRTSKRTLNWDSINVLSIALGRTVHLRDASDGATTTQWLHRLEDHTAAVKAIAWCPFQRNLLASGGGRSDRCLKFWVTHTGSCLNSIDTGSQVCSLLWNKNKRELLSSHGFTQNQLTLWKYPSLVKVAEFTGHTSRVLFMAQSPDGCTFASAAGDGTLRFWNVFGTPEVANPEPFAHLNRGIC